MPAFLFLQSSCLTCGIEGTYGFRGVLESWIIRIDDCFCQNRRDLQIETDPSEFVSQGLLNHIANHALRLGPADVEGHLGKRVFCQFVLQKYVPDLGTVAVSDDYAMSLLYYAHKMLAGLADFIELFLCCSFAFPC